MTKKVKTICWITLAALIILSLFGTPICAAGKDNYIYYSSIVNQNFVYGQRNNGASETGTYRIFTPYTGIAYPANNYDNDYLYVRSLTSSTSNPLKYVYLPLFLANYADIVIYTAGKTANVTKFTVTAVDSINDGIATPCDFSQATDCTEEYDWQNADNGTSVDRTTFALRSLNVHTKVAKTDILRITFDTSTSAAGIFVAVANVSPSVDNGAVTDGLNSVVTAINNNGTTIDNSVQQLINTTISYGDDANYYLDAITYATDGQQVQVSTLQQHFTTALQAINAQQQIMHNNILANAPSEQQVNNNISIDNIAPDMDVSIIGGGSSDTGIGIILNDTRVIAMLVMVFGIATLSYLLFGRKT